MEGHRQGPAPTPWPPWLPQLKFLRQQGPKELERTLRAVDDDVSSLLQLGRHLWAVHGDARDVDAVRGETVESVEGGQVAPVVAEKAHCCETGRRLFEGRAFVAAQRRSQLD